MARNKYPEETVRRILDVAQQLFIEKGYESTSIQNIIDGLGNLSKGAVYHHFKSKEEIFNAVGDRFSEHTVKELKAVRDDTHLSGVEKLKRMFQVSLANNEQDMVLTALPSLLDNPKLLAMQINEIFFDVVPNYVEPIIKQGLEDGSIKTEYPRELSEVILLLANVWLNPFVIEADEPAMEKRVRFFNELLKGMGINLLDEEMLESYMRFCKLPKKQNSI